MKAYWDNGPVQLYQADARSIPLPDQSVHCVVTSPPYFGLRVYKDNDDRGIGLESTVEDYIRNLVDVFREVRRVLRDDGVAWLNLGDSYGGSGKGPSKSISNAEERQGFHSPQSFGESGQRLGIPERVVLALQADGWVWRDTIIWHKKSAMPESVVGWRWERCKVKSGREAIDWNKVPKGWDIGEGSHNQLSGNFRKEGQREATVATFEDCPGCPKCADNDGLVLCRGSWRTTQAFEYIYMLTKSMGYYADGEAVKTASDANRRSVWNDISPEPYGGSHFATFPSDLPRICIQASTSERGCCSECGSQWARVVNRHIVQDAGRREEASYTHMGQQYARQLGGNYQNQLNEHPTETLGWRPTCNCNADVIPATVLDPFSGTATTCRAAQKLGRRAVGVDLSVEYLEQAVRRLSAVTLPMGI